MDQWKLWFILLMPLCLCFDTEETLVKTITGGESDITPLCTTATLHTITLIVCKMNTKRRTGKECHLLYQYGKEIENECYSKFRLIKENGTVFLHMTGLTPVDNGKYSCECSHARGTDTLHLNITVEGDVSLIWSIVGAVIVFIIVSGAVLGLILRKKYGRDHTRSGPPESFECGTPCPVDEDYLNDPYTSLQIPTNDLYQTISSMHQRDDAYTFSPSSNIEMAHSDDQEIHERKAASYETINTIYTK